MIRERRLEDWPGIMRLERCFPTNQRFCRKMLDIMVDEGAMCFVEADYDHNGIVGCIWIDGNEISSLAVLPAYRGRGVAGRLVDAALADIRKATNGTAQLDGRPAAVPALRLYLRHGFVPVKFKPNYYAKGDPSLFMVKVF